MTDQIDQLLRSVLEDFARVEDGARSNVVAALAGSASPWGGESAAFDALRDILKSNDAHAAAVEVISAYVHSAIHSVLATIDGASESAEIGVVELVEAESGEVLCDSLHEFYVDHLFETGRLE